MKSEIEKLIKMSEENLKSSKILYGAGLYKDSISRAYYAMFHSAKALLLTKDINPKKHSGTIKMFGLHFVNEGLIEKIYAKILTKGYEMMEMADYSVIYEPSKEECQNIIYSAEEFVNRIKKALREFYEW